MSDQGQPVQKDKKAKKTIGNALMNEGDFTAASGKTRLTPTLRDAARLILVEGVSPSIAWRTSGVKHRQQLQQAVRTIRRAATESGICVVCERPIDDKTFRRIT